MLYNAPMKPLIGVIMGSKSDWATMTHAAETLEALGIATVLGDLDGPGPPAVLQTRNPNAHVLLALIGTGEPRRDDLPVARLLDRRSMTPRRRSVLQREDQLLLHPPSLLR